MIKKFAPFFSLTPSMAKTLMRIEAAKQAINDLPITITVLAKLRESARLSSVHYSTQIEGNRLTQDEVADVILRKKATLRPRDEGEVKGYYQALQALEQYVAQEKPITEQRIKKLHALVMGNGLTTLQATPYRTGQNVIKDGSTGRIVYLPPQASDVPELMKALVLWIQENNDLPCPLVAGIAHYQFATIHPYYDGNGRTARLLTTFILHLGGYDLKGVYCLEEYYAKNLSAYYDAISTGPSHNYYEGREEADITDWLKYFCDGMAQACEKVKQQAAKAAQQQEPDQSRLLRKLNPKQRKVLELFKKSEEITSQEICALFGFKPRTVSALCRTWVEKGFLVISDPSRKGRKYQLAPAFSMLVYGE
ncbi:Fic family protein [Candidatus Babeliales bacterium]|nr:Fic family protein [Candidatus Babeliales bacterium]